MKHFLALVAPCLLLFLGRADAHYHILLPDKASVERDTPVKFTLRFGHPYEHEMFATQKPKSVLVIAPDGTVADLGAKAERSGALDGKSGTGFTWTYVPAHRGDHIVFVQCVPQWMPDEKEFLTDAVKVILHVQTQNGWDRTVAASLPPGHRPAVGEGMDLIPLTRPYGLRSGTVFQVMVLAGIADPTQKLADILVEVERYNVAPPKHLPADEFITRTVKTDPNGVATVTLPEPGWWAITAIRDGGRKMHEGKEYPVKVRTTLWVPVDEAK